MELWNIVFNSDFLLVKWLTFNCLEIEMYQARKHKIPIVVHQLVPCKDIKIKTVFRLFQCNVFNIYFRFPNDY
ncbi:hypothetical protein MAR_008888 [Mya arenaria]|uniref:Uncharacterized protein n=1 Tax=Mya arenaria TaxID=6604 RepID=A0ABY7DX62_MYAAR|nr:hypothetical protein MAR_008888 [Mya arenaria]